MKDQKVRKSKEEQEEKEILCPNQIPKGQGPDAKPGFAGQLRFPKRFLLSWIVFKRGETTERNHCCSQSADF
jgi:hypothetical protein